MAKSPWLIWFTLTVAAWGAVAALVVLAPWQTRTHHPLWLLNLEFTIFPAIGWAALGTPVAVAVALLLKRWVRVALILLAIVASAQALVAIAELAASQRPLDREIPYLEIHKG